LKRDPRTYVQHILRCIQVIEEWIVGGRDEFMGNEQLNTAVIRKLHELAESVQRLHPAYGDRYPDLPWTGVISFRNVVVHDYMGLNLEKVWLIATEDLPQLKPYIDGIARDLGM
jgi:uncharacterized protein with HEPN domain